MVHCISLYRHPHSALQNRVLNVHVFAEVIKMDQVLAHHQQSPSSETKNILTTAAAILRIDEASLFCVFKS